MSEAIFGNMIGGTAPIKTIKIFGDNELELLGVVTDSEVIFTADAATDIREGKVAATSAGVVTGKKIIPSYETTTSSRLIWPGEDFTIPLNHRDKYDYTKLHCMIAKRNTSVSDSVAVDKIVLNNNVYAVNSTNIVSNVSKDHENKTIDLNITNNTEDYYYIHYFTYKEEI